MFNDAFRIWHEGLFGTINGIFVSLDGDVTDWIGFRLGRLPDFPVDWNEINAGLGQMVLLVDVLAKKLGVEWDKLDFFVGSFEF